MPKDAPEGLCPRCLAAVNLQDDSLFTAPGERPPPPAPEQIAPHFPQLEILSCLGRGGMGVVYKARQKALDRLVALKLLDPGREKDPEFSRRFAREAQALAKLNHPHIVAVHDFGQAGGFFYLLMEYVDGSNLRTLLTNYRFTPEQALAIIPSLCDALQYAHDRGIVHRDIKPENLLLGSDGHVKVADFGLVKMLGAGDHPEEHPVGTPSYMAPEQIASPDQVDNRADIYSLGVVFYEMLTDQRPGPGQIVAPSRKVSIDVRFDEIVLRALAKEPALRYQQAGVLKTHVETIARSSSTPAASRDATPTPASATGPESPERAARFPDSPAKPHPRPRASRKLAMSFLALVLIGVGATIYLRSRLDDATGKVRAEAEKSLAKERAALDGPPAFSTSLALWKQGDKSAAVRRFVETDWTGGRLFPADSVLSLGENDFAALSASDREAKGAEMHAMIEDIRNLARAVDETGVNAATDQDAQQARACFESLRNFGRALDAPQGLLLVRLAGQAIEKKAAKHLASLPAPAPSAPANGAGLQSGAR